MNAVKGSYQHIRHENSYSIYDINCKITKIHWIWKKLHFRETNDNCLYSIPNITCVHSIQCSTFFITLRNFLGDSKENMYNYSEWISYFLSVVYLLKGAKIISYAVILIKRDVFTSCHDSDLRFVLALRESRDIQGINMSRPGPPFTNMV